MFKAHISLLKYIFSTSVIYEGIADFMYLLLSKKSIRYSINFTFCKYFFVSKTGITLSCFILVSKSFKLLEMHSSKILCLPDFSGFTPESIAETDKTGSGLKETADSIFYREQVFSNFQGHHLP